MRFKEYLREIASNWTPPEKSGWGSFGRGGKRIQGLIDQPELKHQRTSTNIPIKLSYAVYNVFQRYWEGQNDPLYAILSRRGNSVDWVEVEASEEEIDRLKEVAKEILDTSDDKGEIRTAESLLKLI